MGGDLPGRRVWVALDMKIEPTSRPVDGHLSPPTRASPKPARPRTCIPFGPATRRDPKDTSAPRRVSPSGGERRRRPRAAVRVRSAVLRPRLRRVRSRRLRRGLHRTFDHDGRGCCSETIWVFQPRRGRTGMPARRKRSATVCASIPNWSATSAKDDPVAYRSAACPRLSSFHAVSSQCRGTPWRSRWAATVVRWIAYSAASWVMLTPVR